jgi:hypothetical protein
MGIRAKRLPEHGVTVFIWSGRLTLEDIRQHFGALDAAHTDRWLQYFDPTVDLSGVDIAAIPELKHLFADKRRALQADRPGVCAVVSAPGTGDLFPGFWPLYASADHDYPAEVAAFGVPEDACAWMNLPGDGCRAVIDAIEGST